MQFNKYTQTHTHTHTHTLSATSFLSHLLRPVPPSITCQTAASYDALVEWALASIKAGDGAAAAELPTPEEVAHDPTVCQTQTYLGHGALRQAHLPIREGGLGLTSSSSIKGAVYIGCHALVLGRVVAAFARGKIPSLLERPPERPMASALIEELKAVATKAKRSQIEEAEVSSWATLAAEEDPQGRGRGTLLNSIMVRLRTKLFLKNELFFKDPEGVNSRSAHPSASCTYWLYSKERAWPWEQFNTLVGAIDQLPTPLQQKWRFSHEPNRLLATVLTICTFF